MLGASAQIPRLASSLAACAQLNMLSAGQRTWALYRLRKLIMSEVGLAIDVPSLFGLHPIPGNQRMSTVCLQSKTRKQTKKSEKKFKKIKLIDIRRRALKPWTLFSSTILNTLKRPLYQFINAILSIMRWEVMSTISGGSLAEWIGHWTWNLVISSPSPALTASWIWIR